MLRNAYYRMKLLFQRERELRFALRTILGVYPRDISHYRLALRHRSLGAGENNERLEYLGDTILNSVVSDIVYRHFPKAGEGKLTQIRSRIVSRESLGRLAEEMGLARLLRSNLHGNSSHNSYMGGNTFEALVGALYLDHGYRQCQRFVERRILPMMTNIDDLMRQDENYRSRLMEWAQKRHLALRYDIVERPDPDPRRSSPVFTATAFLQDQQMASGDGYSKKQAAQEASRQTLELLKKPEVRSRVRSRE